ncbi:MAG: hypothetical protein R3Y19_06885 [Rikenellaceae bacterium]
MKKILSLFVKYPFYGKIFIFTIIISGVVALLNLTMASFPVVEARTLSVSVSYQGATKRDGRGCGFATRKCNCRSSRHQRT